MAASPMRPPFRALELFEYTKSWTRVSIMSVMYAGAASLSRTSLIQWP